jgi:L-ascorbate metabolism protein UlaG (beta-lactamase superfamily)
VKVRRLGWAGLEVEQDEQSLVVDLLVDPGVFAQFYGDPRDELIEPQPGRARAALLTHLHRDHADVAAIERALRPGGSVLRPARRVPETRLDEAATGAAEAALAESGLAVLECGAGDVFDLEAINISALTASDGLGTSQVSWLIEAGGRRILHAGDTLWHGSWWDIAAEHGPIDIAFLPANGAVLNYPQWQPPVDVPASMTPEQAVEAASALAARQLVPIHYNRTFEHPHFYRPARDARERIAAHAASRNVDVLFLDPGDWIEV